MREFVGGVSGAALGYIHGNVRGAIQGWKIGRRLGKSDMTPLPPTPRKRKFMDMTPISVGNTRRKLFVTTTPSSSSRSLWDRTGRTFRARMNQAVRRARITKARSRRGRRKQSRSYGSNIDATAVLDKRKKRFDPRKKRRVRVSKKFRLKVHKAMSEMPYGFYQKIDMFPFYYGAIDQQYGYLVPGAFAPVRFWDAVSVLFNGKTPTVLPAPTDPGMIPQASFYGTKLYIKNSWIRVEIRNNGQRTQNLTIYEAKRKGSLTANLATANGFQDEWVKGLQIMADYGANPQSVTPGTLKAEPMSVPQVQQYWKVQKTKVRLDPGETYVYVLQGPNNEVINFEKLFASNLGTLAGDSLLAYSKFTRDVMMTAYPDLVSTSLGGTGRYSNALSPASQGMIVERSEYFSIECPENIGFTFPTPPIAGGTQQILNNRKNVYAIKNFNPGTAVTGTINRIDEEQPATLESPPTN